MCRGSVQPTAATAYSPPVSWKRVGVIFIFHVRVREFSSYVPNWEGLKVRIITRNVDGMLYALTVRKRATAKNVER